MVPATQDRQNAVLPRPGASWDCNGGVPLAFFKAKRLIALVIRNPRWLFWPRGMAASTYHTLMYSTPMDTSDGTCIRMVNSIHTPKPLPCFVTARPII